MAIDEESLQTAPAFAGLDSLAPHIEAARFIVIPVPYEATTEWLTGTRHAPERIIHSSRLLELYDWELDADISQAGIATTAALEPVLSGPEAMVAEVRRQTASWLAQGKTPVIIGGEHTITLGAVQAMRERYADLSVLHLDAHADLRDSYLGTRCSQATVMRRVHECCPITQVGVRSLSTAERRYIEERGTRTVFWPPEDADWVEAAVASLGDHVYVTIDADVFDSGLLPCVGTPEPGGPGWQDIKTLLESVARRKAVVGFDVVELSPEGRIGDVCAYSIARLIYHFIGCIHHHTTQQEAARNG